MAGFSLETAQQELKSIQKDMAQVATVAERLDTSIEKLTELSTTMSQILAVQGNRLDMYDRTQEKMQETAERRKNESDEAVRLSYLRMERIEQKLQEDMKNVATEMKNDSNSVHNDIKLALNELKTDINKQNETTNTRIATVEKCMWGIAGMASLILVLIASLDSLANIM